jgi:hypothetical protein
MFTPSTFPSPPFKMGEEWSVFVVGVEPYFKSTETVCSLHLGEVFASDFLDSSPRQMIYKLYNNFKEKFSDTDTFRGKLATTIPLEDGESLPLSLLLVTLFLISMRKGNLPKMTFFNLKALRKSK